MNVGAVCRSLEFRGRYQARARMSNTSWRDISDPRPIRGLRRDRREIGVPRPGGPLAEVRRDRAARVEVRAPDRLDVRAEDRLAVVLRPVVRAAGHLERALESRHHVAREEL